MIRSAVTKDIPQLAEQYKKFYSTTEHVKIFDTDEASIIRRCEELIDAGILLVNSVGDKLNGSIGLYVKQFPFNDNFLIATEIVWYIDPEAQAAGIGKLLKAAAEKEAKEVFGCTAIIMAKLSTSPKFVHDFYVQDGYAYSEKTYIKVL